MCDSIIFDMDGTLVNFLKPMLASWNLTCQTYGLDKVIEYEDLKSWMGLNGHDIVVRMFPDIDEDEATRRVYVCSAEEVEYFDKVEIGPTYIPNEQFLIELSKKHKLFIVSNCLEGYIEIFLKKYNFEKYFIETANAASGITKAQNIKNLVKKHNLKTPIYVGDTIKDKESSDEAGVKFIYASYGFGEVVCDNKIEKLEDLLNLWKIQN